MNKKAIVSDKLRCFTSMILKIVIVIFVIIGVHQTYHFGYSGGKYTFLYFTCQSNLWIGLFDLLCLIALLINILKLKKYELHKVYLYIGQVLTVSIALTGITYNLILGPGIYLFKPELLESYNPYHLGSCLCHIVVPVLSIIDFLIFTRKIHFKLVDGLYSLIPVLGYFIFAIIAFYLKIDFGHGTSYPYFFLNLESPAGIFGFSSEAPYFMGTFYWLIVGICIVFGISYAFIAISNRLNKSYVNNN